MIEPKVLREAQRLPWIKCERCGKQLFYDSTGNFQCDQNGRWHGVCYACLRPEED